MHTERKRVCYTNGGDGDAVVIKGLVKVSVYQLI